VNDLPINLSTQGLPSTVLPAIDPALAQQLETALALDDESERRTALAAIAAGHPRNLDVWSHLGEVGRDPVESYAYFRVGYHRGLDQLRHSGWRGSGYVRWSEPTNRGFLRSLYGLQRTAAAIGEADEAQRCAEFLMQLDPTGPWKGQ
jgi:Protein of unknown function (DUF3151)